MANTLITPTWIGRDVLRVAKNSTRFVRSITKKLSDTFSVEGTKVGATVGVRLPQRFTTSKGEGIQIQGLTDSVVYVTITDQANVAWSWSSRQATLEVEETRERYVNPAAVQIANTMDKDGLARLYLDVYQSQGTPGTPPTANTVYFQAADDLTNSAVPPDSRIMVVNAQSGTAIANANLSLFNMGGSKNAFEEGKLAAGGLKWKEWWEDVNVKPHTYGTYGGTPLVNGASQTGASLVTDGWTSGGATLNKGDVFTIGSGSTGVYSVNPQSYQSTTTLQRFVVTETISDTTGAMTIAISPSLITSGAYQTVVASPADNATINVIGSSAVVSPQNLGFHKQAFCMASADLVMPKQGEAARVRAPETGLSLRYWEASDIMTDQHPSRLDVIYGFKTLRPDWAVRVQS